MLEDDRSCELDELYDLISCTSAEMDPALAELRRFCLVVCRRVGRRVWYQATPKGMMVLARSEGRLTV